MEAVIVFKADGTIQCAGNDPIPLEHHAAELRKIGASTFCGQGNVPGPFVVNNVCGAPTGMVNAYAIPKKDWEMILAGIVGTMGFRLWTSAPYPDLDLDDDCHITEHGPPSPPSTSVCVLPVLVRELVGRPCRCYEQGDKLTLDYLPDRVNIEHDGTGRISDIWFG